MKGPKTGLQMLEMHMVNSGRCKCSWLHKCVGPSHPHCLGFPHLQHAAIGFPPRSLHTSPAAPSAGAETGDLSRKGLGRHCLSCWLPVVAAPGWHPVTQPDSHTLVWSSPQIMAGK